MQIGAIFPTTEIGNDPVVIRDWAQAAEALGYEHIVAFDHVLGGPHEDREPKLMGPYTEKDAFHEPIALFGYLAGVTRSIELATGIIILPQRQAVLFAKQAAEIDLLSGGRLRVGVGTGWNYLEYQALGVPFEERGKRFDEQVEVLRELWRAPLVDFDGDYHRIDRAGLLPLPGREIPIWFGAVSPIPLRRALRLGDGLMFGSSPSVVRRLYERARDEAERQGRAWEGFGTEATVDFSLGPERWEEEVQAWRELGGTHLALRAMDTAVSAVGGTHVGYRGPQDYIDALEKFKKVVG